MASEALRLRPGPHAGAGAGEGDRYEIERLLGRGGFGEVYLARYRGRQGFSRRVALKVLRTEVAHQDELARRVRDEARLLGLVHHRAVVGVDRLAQIEGRWCIVMEFVDGASLDVLTRVSPLPLGPALEIGAEVCRAMHVCTTTVGPGGEPLNLLHRDIKPSNIILTRHGDVKLLDFGIAHAAFDGRESETRTLVFGTPGYMAPERFELVCGPPADVYALGVVLYEILARRRFGRTSANVARHHARVDANLDLLIEAREDLPAEFILLIRDLLDADPEVRPTALELQARLTAMATTAGGQSLFHWAHDAVPAAQSIALVEEVNTQAEVHASDDWAGRVLTEDRTTLEPAKEDPASETSLIALPLPERRISSSAWSPARWVVIGLALAGLGLFLWREVSAPNDLVAALDPRTDTVAPPGAEPPPPPSGPVSSPEEEGPYVIARRTERRSSYRPTTAKMGPSCPQGQLRFICPSGERVQVQQGDRWVDLPSCVDWRPIISVRREGVSGKIAVGRDRAQVLVSCGDQTCSGDYHR